MKDDRLRWSSTQLLDHTFLKEPVPDLLPPSDNGGPEKNNGKLLVGSLTVNLLHTKDDSRVLSPRYF